MQKVQPNADYDRLTMVGHSNGGDISMYFAKMYPDQIKKVVTLDNLRVPFLTDGRFKILSFRSKDPQFKTDPGVVPNEDVCERSGITVVQPATGTPT
jgi:pimeloyl-ACP methyl ester carboxylesterase